MEETGIKRNPKFICLTVSFLKIYYIVIHWGKEKKSPRIFSSRQKASLIVCLVSIKHQRIKRQIRQKRSSSSKTQFALASNSQTNWRITYYYSIFERQTATWPNCNLSLHLLWDFEYKIFDQQKTSLSHILFHPPNDKNRPDLYKKWCS